ncbi:MAG: glucose-1-phosphate adenylyltransferase, partial [Candidatus Omnitrophica bacterium]|nr:glucose-1-phosphate adenylyltransferase [Candidatus Omnitrophota bacterium]
GLRSRIGRNSKIEDSIILGCDFYESLDTIRYNKTKGICSLGIGGDCHIKKAIIDKNARVGNNVKILNKENLKTYDGDNVFIRDGIVVVAKNASIPNGTVI